MKSEHKIIELQEEALKRYGKLFLNPNQVWVALLLTQMQLDREEEQKKLEIKKKFIQELIEEIIKLPLGSTLTSSDTLTPDQRAWLMVGIHATLFDVIYLLRKK